MNSHVSDTVLFPHPHPNYHPPPTRSNMTHHLFHNLSNLEVSMPLGQSPVACLMSTWHCNHEAILRMTRLWAEKTARTLTEWTIPGKESPQEIWLSDERYPAAHDRNKATCNWREEGDADRGWIMEHQSAHDSLLQTHPHIRTETTNPLNLHGMAALHTNLPTC